MSRSVRTCFVCILSMLFAGASGMAWARSITSISVDTAASTATIACEAGEPGDGHVVYFAWSADSVDYGDDIGDWPNFVRVGRIGDGTWEDSACWAVIVSFFKTYFNTGCGRIL